MQPSYVFWRGSNYFLCNARFMLGPNPFRFVLTVVLLNLAFIMFISTSVIYQSEITDLIWSIGISTALAFAANYCLVYGAFTDPGYI